MSKETDPSATLEHAGPEEDVGQKAQRLRGAAVVAQSAIAELWTAAGWFEAAKLAQQYGLLDEDEFGFIRRRSPRRRRALLQ